MYHHVMLVHILTQQVEYVKDVVLIVSHVCHLLSVPVVILDLT